MNVVEFILKKRDGGSLSPEDVHRLIAAYTDGDVPDYQMSAFLMASFLNGMTEKEAVALTDAMLQSGETVNLDSVTGTKVDKHSTGGVGDKISLILAPIVASCGVPVPMISGRGLGHTGGTLDKLESIPGFSTQMGIEAYRRQLGEIGIVMIGQTAEIAPADRKLYALRDVTGTVEFIPFIAASIMSKKLAEGIDALVLDVKCGSGAFMKTEASARQLAENLVAIGERFGKSTVAWTTGMESPLGRAIGNWPEVEESIACLKGEWEPDLEEVTMTLAAEMIVLGGAADTIEEGRRRAAKSISDGSAFVKFAELIERQGGDPSIIDDSRNAGVTVHSKTLQAPDEAGPFVDMVDALAIGRAAVALGAGRLSKEDDVDPFAGIYLLKKESEPVCPGEDLCTVSASDPGRIERILSDIESAFSYTDTPFSVQSRLLNRYADGEWMHPVAGTSV